MTTREQQSFAQRWTEYSELEQLRDHWYWRPGWRVGRSFYTWHLTFDGQDALHTMVARIQDELLVDGLDLVPMEGLHLTMQGLGFTDDVPDADVSAIVEAARRRCAQLQPFDLTLGPVDPDWEGTGLLVTPWEPVEQLRLTIRAAVAEVWPEVPEQESGFRPHVTVAYSSAPVAVNGIRDRMAALRKLSPASVHIDQAQLIALNRDEHVYRWNVVESVPLGRP